jgi:hypothetical protein
MRNERPVPHAPTGTAAAAKRSGGIRLETVAWIFLRIGATGFGGLGVMLSLLERELVEGRHLLTRMTSPGRSR